MLKINNIKLNRCRILLITSLTVLGGLFLFQYLTFIPEYSSATEISTTDPISLPNIEGEITTKFGTAEQGYKTYMQEISLSYCQSLPDKTTGQLADGRDGKIYWATKLAGTCWMTQDLDLDLGPNGPELKITNDGDNLYKGTALDAETQTEWTGGANVASSNRGWPTYNGNPTQNINWYERDTTHGTEHTSLGNLYSFEAATAGTGHTVTTDGTEVPGSICPAGWKLPIGSSSTAIGSFNGLGLTGSNKTGNPYYFQYSGYINGSLILFDSNGYYWSATSYSSGFAYRLYFYSGYVDPTSNGGRYFGFSVRCAVRDPDYTAPTVPTPSDADINDPNILVSIPNIITLSIDSEVVDIDTSTSNPAEGNFTATVTSNSKYNLALSATAPEGQTPHTDLKNEDPNKTTSIPALSSTNPIVTEADESWWGIKCTNPTDSTNSTNCTKTSYAGLTLTPETYFTSTSGTPTTGTETPFTIGIKVSPNLPSGTYSTSIQVTASSTGSN